MTDLAYAIRTLRGSPILAATAVITLAVSIGAITAIFSVINAVLLHPLPYKNPDRLVYVCRDNAATSSRTFLFANADFFDLRDGTKPVFEDIGAVFTYRAFVPREDGSMEQISKAQVTPGFFRMMGARIAYGRDFAETDAVPQPNQPEELLPIGSVAILSDAYWRRRYGGDAGVLGHEMVSAGQRGPIIVGVLERNFKLMFPSSAPTDEAPDAWIANNIGYDSAKRNFVGLRIVGRLAKGVSLERAQTQVDAVAAEQRRRIPWYEGLSIRLEPMHRYLVKEVRGTILALMGSTILLLLIACGNVTNLMLVRASLRQRELAVRIALGGSRLRVTRLIAAEVFVLSMLGVLFGVGLAWLGVHEILAIMPQNMPRQETIRIDWRVLVFAAIVGFAVFLASGLLLALATAGGNLMTTLRSGRFAEGRGTGQVLRNTALIIEIAVSFVLLTGSGLMFRSFLGLQRVDLGYDPHGLFTLFIAREWPVDRQNGRLEALREIQRQLQSLPGVVSVTASPRLPLASDSRAVSWSPDESFDDRLTQPADIQYVLPGYFETMRTRLIEGRTFTEEDNQPGHQVAVIDELFAARAFPNQPVIGKQLFSSMPTAPQVLVIGVVAHQRQTSISVLGRGQIYLTEGLAGFGVSRYWQIRTSKDGIELARAIQDRITALDRRLVITKIQTMQSVVTQAQGATRFSLLLLGMFSGISLLLSSVGLYGVLSFVVRQRTREIGVRMALGATPSNILYEVLRYSFRLSGCGIVAGLAAAMGATRVMSSMLFGVKPTDPSTFVAITVLFLSVVLLASWLPARWATHLAPMKALRED
jgi:predicted permease